jgi:hypothetical protein
MKLTATQGSFWRRHRWSWWLSSALIVALVLLAITVDVVAHRAEPFVRERIVRALSSRFHARVELESFHLSLGNGLRGEWGVWAQGHGLRIWPPAQVEGVTVPLPQTGIQPLVQLGEFRFHAPLRFRSGDPIHINLLRLKGLEVHIPPRSHLQRPGKTDDSAAAPQAAPSAWNVRFQVNTVDCIGAQIELQTDKPDKLPLEFMVDHFRVTGVVPGQAMNFEAELTNPKPPGLIHSTGNFGPWNVADPGESPITGDYRFEHADLSVFKGIAGILNSTGHYTGTLRDLTVDGETDMADFQLSKFGNPIALHTDFHARVDGTNGDTWLDPVDATMGRSHFTASGRIVRVLARGDDGRLHSTGHDIALTINVGRARIEDFLHLASKSSTPLLTGDVNVKAHLHIPPGADPVPERMALKGKFTLDNAEFTSPSVQKKISDLSNRGQGRPDDSKTVDPAGTRSRMEGVFLLGDGMLKLPALSYNVPGANIELNGFYLIHSQFLDFSGIAKMQATVSQMVGGWKGKLLKPADRFFKKNGSGAEIPIYISGTREKPEFGYDFERTRSTKPERPGPQ